MVSIDNKQPEGRTVIADVRRAGIAEILRDAGSITVADVEERFGVSPMTARRDLAELERRGVARRTHGGAVLPTIAGHEDSFLSRVEHHSAEKAALGAAAAQLVVEEESVFLDSSSSAYHAAKAILDRGIRATLITNSQPIMELVASHPGTEAELIGVGGSLRRLTRSFVGPVATSAVLAHVADRMFFSVKGLSRDRVLMDADPLEAEVKRSMLRRADEVVLLIDQSKLDARGLSVIGDLDAVHGVLAAGLGPERRAWLTATGVRLDVVGRGTGDGR